MELVTKVRNAPVKCCKKCFKDKKCKGKK